MSATHVTIHHAIAAIASRQRGVVDTGQLRRAGCSDARIHSLVRRGVLHRQHHGVYAVGHESLSREGRWMAAVLAAGAGAVVSHVSAAQLWGITRRRSTRAEVSAPRYRRPISGVTTHLLRPLVGTEAATTRDGIPVTTVPWTIVDLAQAMDAEELAFVMHEAEYRGLFDAREVQRVIDQNPRFRGRGVLRETLAMHVAGDTGRRSRLERRVGAYLESTGVPRARTGLHVRTPMGLIEVDCGWPERNIYLEIDGVGHRRRSIRRVDRERTQALDLAGWSGFVVRGDEFDIDPGAATAGIRAAFR